MPTIWKLVNFHEGRREGGRQMIGIFQKMVIKKIFLAFWILDPIMAAMLRSGKGSGNDLESHLSCVGCAIVLMPVGEIGSMDMRIPILRIPFYILRFSCWAGDRNVSFSLLLVLGNFSLPVLDLWSGTA